MFLKFGFLRLGDKPGAPEEDALHVARSVAAFYKLEGEGDALMMAVAEHVAQITWFIMSVKFDESTADAYRRCLAWIEE